MSRITGSYMQIVGGFALISIVVLGALAPPEDGAPVDVILIDPGGLAHREGKPSEVDPEDDQRQAPFLVPRPNPRPPLRTPAGSPFSPARPADPSPSFRGSPLDEARGRPGGTWRPHRRPLPPM